MADVAVPLPRQKLPAIASPYHGLAHGSHHAMSTRSGGSSAPLRHGGLPGPPLQLSGPSPSSSSVASGNSLKRKRAGSTDADNGGSHPRARDLVVKVPTTATGYSFTPAFSLSEHMCLCTPAPKIPRPRNAFILYRQHHQAQVVAQHPGLANPEISKIIGEQWRDQPEEVKNSWKRLAEEEKARHQKQYPEYRYQPRRGGKGVSARPTSAEGEDPNCCPKCGGRYIATPRTPSTPYMTPTPPKSTVPQSFINPNPRVIESDHLRRPSAQGSSSNMPSSHSGFRRQYGHGTTYEGDEYDAVSPTSRDPDPKRRRYDDRASHYYPPSSPHGPYAHPQRQYRPTSTSAPSAPGMTMYLPNPNRLYHNPLPMAPPPRPTGSYAGHPPHHPHHGTPTQTPRAGGFDESLRLPPLQTHMATATAGDGNSAAAGLGITNAPRPLQIQHHRQSSREYASGNPAVARESSAQPASAVTPAAAREMRDAAAQRSIEAMVMSIPYLNKLKVLARISPPLAHPGPGSPAVEVRGPVIAVEGHDARLVAAVGAVLERVLAGTGEHAVRVWGDGPTAREGTEGAGEGDADAEGEADSEGAPEGLRSGAAPSSMNPFAAYLATITEWYGRSEEIVKYITAFPPGPSRASSAPSSNRPAPKRTPVALLSGGFSLTLSDRFARSIAIGDNYSPVDHWQWMATLWRGIVGPDLSVVVRGGAGGDGGDGSDAGSRAGSPGAGVELKAQGVMVVRFPEAGGGEAGPVLDEKTERRLAFEVVEWVRAGSYKEGGGMSGSSGMSF